MHHSGKRSKISCLILVLCMLLTLTCSCSMAQPKDAALSQPATIQPITLTTADRTTACEKAETIDLSVIEDSFTLTQAGCYVLTGQLDGSIRVAAEEQIVHLVLDNVYVNAPYGPALEVVSAGKVIVTLQEGSENTLRDSGKYPSGSDPDACLYSMCDLTINGGGRLNIYGFFKDAIHTKDYLKVLSGELFVQSKRHCLHGNDGIYLDEVSFTVQSERSGLCSTKAGDAPKGNVEIRNCTGSIIAGEYGIACAADLSMTGSEVYIKGIFDNIQAEGVSLIAEGNLLNE